MDLTDLIDIDRESACGRCESPLSPAETGQHDDHTRRAIARMPKAFPLHFLTQWPAHTMLHGCAVDLSTHGMRFLSDNYLPVGTLLSIDSDVAAAVARVRSCTRAGAQHAAEFEIGVQFITLRFHRTQGGFVSVTA